MVSKRNLLFQGAPIFRFQKCKLFYVLKIYLIEHQGEEWYFLCATSWLDNLCDWYSLCVR